MNHTEDLQWKWSKLVKGIHLPDTNLQIENFIDGYKLDKICYDQFNLSCFLLLFSFSWFFFYTAADIIIYQSSRFFLLKSILLPCELESLSISQISKNLPEAYPIWKQKNDFHDLWWVIEKIWFKMIKFYEIDQK